MCSLGGPNGYVPIGLPDDKTTGQNSNAEPVNMKRARVLCSYDASGTNELNLTANEVSRGIPWRDWEWLINSKTPCR